MNSKIFISIFYAFACTLWPPHNSSSQERKIDTTSISGFDSADFYDLQNAKIEFKQVAGTTKQVQKEAMKNLALLEKRKRIKYDTVYVPVYIPVYDTNYLDTIKHKKNFLQKIFNP